MPILPAALEAGAALDAPYLTFHQGSRREEVRARAALAGARRCASALIREGVKPGDRVPILLPTSPGFVHAFLGAQLAGAVPVPLPTPLTFGRLDRYLARLEHVIEDADASVLITAGRYERAAAENPAIQGRIRASIDPASLTETPTSVRWPSLDAEMLALLQYTSGTSGRPKGVAITHRALAANTAAIVESLRITDADVGVSWLPVFHDMGLIGGICSPLARPFPVHVLAPEAFIMRPKRWLTTLSELGATVSPAPNFAYELCVARVEDVDGLRLDGWRAALDGAEAVHASTLRRFGERFGPAGFSADAMTPVYGLAESTLAVSATPPEEAPSITRFVVSELEGGRAVKAARGSGRPLVSVGRPVGGAEIRIAKRGRVVGLGEIGEIQVRGPSLMQGYFRRREDTEAAFDGSWLRTGDLGFVHGGRLFVAGRSKDLVVKCGRNVYPDDVEQVAVQTDGVRGGAAAFGVVDDERGTESLVLVIEVRERDPVGREEIAKRVRGGVLATLSVSIDELVLWPLGAIPRTTSGKIRRRACRAKWTGER